MIFISASLVKIVTPDDQPPDESGSFKKATLMRFKSTQRLLIMLWLVDRRAAFNCSGF